MYCRLTVTTSNKEISMSNTEFNIQTRIDSTTEDTYKALNPTQKKSWRIQSKFLKCYTETRSKSVSASYSGVTYRTVSKWEKDNRFGFAERLEEADFEFCENLEQLALERVKMQDAKSNPVLLITLLNANLPMKYRPTVVMADDTAKSVLSELRQIAKESPVASEEQVQEQSALEQVHDILNEKGSMS